MSIEERFISFIDSYKHLILKVAGIYCKSEEERKDLRQEIILQLWRSFPKYNEKFALSTWTYRIALNVSISFVRKNNSRKKAINNYENHTSLISIEDENIEEDINKLYEAIKFLKPLDKAIISLHLEGCQNKEVSKVLGITPSNVSTRMVRIKKQLKDKFTQNK